MPIETAVTFPLAPLTREIIGGFHDVVHELGVGYLEQVTQRALVIALRDRGLLVETNLALGVTFRGQDIGHFYPDVVVERLVIVEIKVTNRIEPFAQAQILNYLRCAGGGVGLLLKFGENPESKRFVSGHSPISLPVLPKDPVANIKRWM